MKTTIKTKIKTKFFPGNSSFANANPANVVKKNWPMSTIVTSKKVFKKYCSHGAPSHATRKLSKVQEDIRLKFTASDVEWNAAQKANSKGEIQITAKRIAAADST